MDFYRLRPDALPRSLYRVDYFDTWSKFQPGQGFQAAIFHDSSSSASSTFRSAADLTAFSQALRDQLDARSGVRGPFVALFGSRAQARIWALRWAVRNQRACEVVEISVAVLRRLEVPVFHPHTLRFRIPDLCNTHPWEYFCLHSVPEAAVGIRRSTASIPIVSVLHHHPHPPRPHTIPPSAPSSPAPLPPSDSPPPPPPPFTDFADYSSFVEDDEDDDEDDREDETTNTNRPQCRRERWSTHQAPGSEGRFYDSE